MIQCPKCQQTLPDTFVQCQFCGADVSKVPRPVPIPKQTFSSTEPAKWVWLAYYGIGSYWMLGGLMDIFRGLGAVNGAGSFAYIGMAFGALTVIVGLGLVLRLEFIRGLVNILCWLRIVFGLLGAWGALMGTLVFGPLALLFLVFSIFDVATGVLMIYLIGETEKYSPN